MSPESTSSSQHGDPRNGADSLPPRPRRRFLSGLGAALAGIGLMFRSPPVQATLRPTTLHLHDCRIAGSHYYDCARALPWLQPGEALDLRREPGNRHDKLAIEVYWLGLKLGYIPRADNAVIAGLLDRGQRIHAEILDIDDDPVVHWEPLLLRVYLEQHP